VYSTVPGISVFIAEGFHVPLILSIDSVGKAGAASYWQNGPIGSKLGVTCSRIVTSIETGSEHCPSSGINVKVNTPTKFVLMNDGLHVPVMPSLDVDDSAGASSN